ncbi:alpha/beta-hydrolase [Auricularia subglabra TFB-10046 SS5]|nr:alpha/beta-hydrolase [Auricularia subglabra TFB-10046 SS5]
MLLERTVTLSSGAELYCKYRLAKQSSTQLPVLYLLHGFPQNHHMWDDFVKHLPDKWPLLIPDLPGYGNSKKEPSQDADATAYSKSAWAVDLIELADAVFPADAYVGDQRRERVKLIPYGHDRGARVAYRMALNHPDRVVGLGVLDIVPTAFMWDKMNLAEDLHAETRGSHHWIFLASPRPIPETLIAREPGFYFGSLIKSWSGPKARADANAKWVHDSLEPFLDKDEHKAMARIVAACEDYRAGSTKDIKDDLAAGIVPASMKSAHEAKVPFNIPLLALSSHYLRRRYAVDDVWGSLCPGNLVLSLQIGDESIGHFFVNEAPEETLKYTLQWLNEFWKE